MILLFPFLKLSCNAVLRTPSIIKEAFISISVPELEPPRAAAIPTLPFPSPSEAPTSLSPSEIPKVLAM